MSYRHFYIHTVTAGHTHTHPYLPTRTHLHTHTVTAGGIVGHSLCTGLAVVGGRILAARISEKTVATTGGALFLLFCAHSLIMGP